MSHELSSQEHHSCLCRRPQKDQSGHSEGSGTRGLPQSALDLDAALDYIESDESLNSFPVFLMGHSWGGYAVTAVLNFDHEIAGSVSVAGYNDPMTMISEFADGMMGDSSGPWIGTWSCAFHQE